MIAVTNLLMINGFADWSLVEGVAMRLVTGPSLMGVASGLSIEHY